ncbi:MAG: DUF4922 domain-containing protein [Gammaproteobacteria bacterium]
MTDLAAAILAADRHATAAGAIKPLDVQQHPARDAGLDYVVCSLSSLALKHAAQAVQAAPRPRDFNPFLPYEQDLHVADLSDSHVLILNKFPLQARHVLMITRAFVAQEMAPDGADFHALARVMTAVDGVGFYNSAKTAGASQPHKHLQHVPLRDLPIEPLLPRAGAFDTPRRVDGLSFRHAFVRLDPAAFAHAASAAARLTAAFEAGCAFCGLRVEDGRLPPHNFLATRDWMLIVPRSTEYWEEGTVKMSMNAMSFMGTLFVRHPDHVEAVRRAGFLRIVAAVTYPD